MKIFTDKTETAFFLTDNYIKDLKSIEINSIAEFVARGSLDLRVLLGVGTYVMGRFDELQLDLCENFHPELSSRFLVIDFIIGMKPREVLADVLLMTSPYHQDEILDDYKNSIFCKKVEKGGGSVVVTFWGDEERLRVSSVSGMKADSVTN